MSEAIPLQDADRAILDIESPTIAGHTCKVFRIGGHAPGLEEIRARVAERIELVPELRSRLGGSDERPAWVPWDGFDPEARVVGVGSGQPIAEAEVPDQVARLFEQRLDRDRPLWQIHVAALDGGGTVAIWRIHHALADGTTAMRFAHALLFDHEPDPGGDKRAAPHDHTHPDEGRRRRHLAAVIDREFGESLHRSPFDGNIGAERRIAFASVELAPLHDAAKSLEGATVNDAVLSIVGGALRRWIEEHHGSLGAIRVRVPVSLHHQGESAANLDSFFSLRLPLNVADPRRRLHQIHAETARRKADHDAEELEALHRELAGVSPRLRRFCGKIEASPRNFALSVSNVPGPREPVSILGAPVEALHSIAEIGNRHALRVAIVSLAGRLHFGFCADPAIVDDLEVMARGVETEADALIRAARKIDQISFRPLERSDFPLVARWLAEPVVARWWNHDASPEAVEADFGPSVDGKEPTDIFAVLLDDQPVGLIQRYRIDSYPESEQELKDVCELPAAALGIDYLIGDPDARGKGLGAELIASFVEQSWAAFPDSRDVIVPVASGNRASWRSLENAGFTLFAEGDLKPDNPRDPPDHRIYRLPRPPLS